MHAIILPHVYCRYMCSLGFGHSFLFLDEIVKDYESFEQDLLELRQKNDALVSANDKAKKKIAELEANNAILLAKVKNIKDNSKVSLENIDLLNRIKSLENALYKAGINPTKIK